jgi:hypothetical protein
MWIFSWFFWPNVDGHNLQTNSVIVKGFVKLCCKLSFETVQLHIFTKLGKK